MQKNLRLTFEGKYVLCLVEGGAEMEIVDTLVDTGCLAFSREDLVGRKVHRRMTAADVQEKFLSLDYARPLVILRISCAFSTQDRRVSGLTGFSGTDSMSSH